jgi:Cft2 family RNA processing exonuclease
MSTFNGQIDEIGHISVDHFENKESKCYFLSHCHSDHMKSLENLSQMSQPLYTTELSALIIKKKYPSINICVLEYGSFMNIEFTDDNGKEVKFLVTALNATGHCMGACMLLFQIEGLDILYTGDFRISLKHAQNITILKKIKEDGQLILYLDTTFLNESYKHFPSQQDSCSKVIEVIDKHLSKSSSHRGIISQALTN